MKMKELFDRGEFVVSAEVGPPKGIHVDELVEEAKTYLKDVHAVNVTDNQSSVMRLGSLAMCKVLKDAGMNPIFQLACRDRNRIALESDLLSAAMLGIDNILCLTGDHTKMGDHPQAKPVFDLDSVSLLHTVKLLESGVVLYHGPRNDLPRDYAPKEVIPMLNGLKNKLCCVRGNCEAEVDQMVLDLPVMADYCILPAGEKLIYATHGHIYNG